MRAPGLGGIRGSKWFMSPDVFFEMYDRTNFGFK